MNTSDTTFTKPAALKKGDKVGLIAPASRLDGPSALERAVKAVEWMGFKPVVGKHAMHCHGFTAGLDSERLSDLMEFFADSSIKGIFCLSGGWGSLRLLGDIDYQLIAKNPKVLVGSDDNTALILAIHKLSTMVVFHGPNIGELNSAVSWEALQKAVTRTRVLEPLAVRIDKIAFGGAHYAPVVGKASGCLIGGNLTALGSLMGTPFQPRFENTVAFFEDKNERNDMLDRWFSTLFVSGDLAKIGGFAFGDFVNCGRKGAYNMLSIEDLFGDRLKEIKKPSCFGFPIGQGEESYTIPIGVNVTLDTELGKLTFNESALN